MTTSFRPDPACVYRVEVDEFGAFFAQGGRVAAPFQSGDRVCVRGVPATVLRRWQLPAKLALSGYYFAGPGAAIKFESEDGAASIPLSELGGCWVFKVPDFGAGRLRTAPQEGRVVDFEAYRQRR